MIVRVGCSFLLIFLLISAFFTGKAQCLQSVSAGISHSAGTHTDGSLWTWGFNGSGQLGDNTDIERQIPVRIGTGTDWKMVSAGGNHTLAVKNDGTLWSWGENIFGEVGDGTAGNIRKSPVRIGTGTDWKYVSAGRTFSFAIKTDGTLWAWGDNLFGQLGRGTILSPGQVGTATDWKIISAGGNHTLAIKTDGTLWAWGFNSDGQLGDGTGVDKNTPVKIGSATNWKSIAAGYDFSMAVKTDGTLWTWGNNETSQLGNGSDENVITVTQLGTETNWEAIAAGSYSAHAIKANGTLWSWGWNAGVEGSTTTPEQLDASTSWTQISSGEKHAFAFKNDGTFWGWGDGTWGALGNNSWNGTPQPQLLSSSAVSGNSTQDFCKVATVTDLAVTGVGIKWYSAISGGTALPSTTPLVNGSHYFASGTKFNCESSSRFEVAVSLTEPPPVPTGAANQSLCTGSVLNDIVVTVLPGADISWYTSPTEVGSLSYDVPVTNGTSYYISQTIDYCESSRLKVTISINITPPPTAAATQTPCDGSKLETLVATGSNIQWYANKFSFSNPMSPQSRLGSGSYYASQTIAGCESLPTTRVQVTVALRANTVKPPTGGIPLMADQVFTGGSASMVLDTEGKLWGWGWNQEGQLADGTNDHKRYPVLVDEGPWETISIGSDFNLGIKQDKSLWSWGSRKSGQLGVGENPNYNYEDLLRIGTDNDWTSVGAANANGAAVKSDGTLWAWGDSFGGMLGDNGVERLYQYAPERVGPGNDWVSVDGGGGGYFLALRAVSYMYGWGQNNYGTIGIGHNDDLFVPRYSGHMGWKMISAGPASAAGVMLDGTLWTWGAGGALGREVAPSTNIPIQVNGESNWETVSMGSGFAFAIKTDGTLWAWGANTIYQLGDGTTTSRSVPVQIGTDTNWKSVSAGSRFGLASKTDGSVWAWGQNDYGQIGDGTITTVKVPKMVYSTVQPVCTDATTLADLSYLGTDIRWYGSVTGEDLLAPQTILNDGTVYFGSQKVDGCESFGRISVLVVKRTEPTLPPTGLSAQSFCAGKTVASLTATGSNIKWYSSSSGGTALTLTTPLVHGNQYFASQNFGTCESASRLAVTVSVGASVPAPTGTAAQSICAAGTLANLSVTGSDIKWYSAATAGTLLPPSTALTNGRHYYATQTNGECESSARLDVTVTINNTPQPTGEWVQVFCEDATVADFVVSGSALKWYENPESPTTIPLSTPLINQQYYVSQTINGCESTSRLIVIANVHPFPDAPQGLSSQAFQEGKILADIAVNGGEIRWYLSEADVSDLTKVLSPSESLIIGHTYYATQTVNGCESVTALPVTITLITALEPDGLGLSLYPNPVKTYLKITASQIIEKVTLTNTVGQNLLQQTVDSNLISLDLTHLKPGLYLAQVQINGRAVTVKVVKE